MLRSPVMLLALLLVAASNAAAQRRAAAEGSGMWYAFGAAPGWARVTCSICAGDREGGISVFAALGGSTSRALRVGAELAAWRGGSDGVTETVMSIGAAGYWYPSARRRLYIRGGVALVTHRASDGSAVITSSGIGPLMGIGYEYRAGRKWVLAPFFHYSVGVFGGGVKFNGGQADNTATVGFFQLGVSLTRR